MHKISTYISTLVAAITLVAPVTAFAAGSAAISLTASKTTVQNGSTFTVSAYEDGTDVTYAKVRLAYDASKLSCSAGNVSGGPAFPNAMSADIACSGGIAVMSYYVNGGSTAPAGSRVGSVTFTAIADAGTASVSVLSGSQLAVNGTNVWNGASSSASVALEAVPAPTTPSNTTTTTTPASTSPSATTQTTASSNNSGQQANTANATGSANPAVAMRATQNTAETKGAQTTTLATNAKPAQDNQEKSQSNLWLVLLALLALGALGYVYRAPLLNKLGFAGASAPVVAAKKRPAKRK